MLAFAHFMGASLFYYLISSKYKSLFTFLFIGTIGIMPDFDLLIDFIPGSELWLNGLLVHRNLTHTIIPAVVIGLVTLWLFKSYLAGLFAYFSHFILDTLDNGAIAIWPNIRIDLIPNLWQNGFDQILASSIAGSIFLFIILGIEGFRWYKDRQGE